MGPFKFEGFSRNLARSLFFLFHALKFSFEASSRGLLELLFVSLVGYLDIG